MRITWQWHRFVLTQSITAPPAPSPSRLSCRGPSVLATPKMVANLIESATASPRRQRATRTIPSDLRRGAPTTPTPLLPFPTFPSFAFVGGQILLANSRVRNEIETEERSFNSPSPPRSSFLPSFLPSTLTRRVGCKSLHGVGFPLPIITAAKLPIKAMNVTL